MSDFAKNFLMNPLFLSALQTQSPFIFNKQMIQKLIEQTSLDGLIRSNTQHIATEITIEKSKDWAAKQEESEEHIPNNKKKHYKSLKMESDMIKAEHIAIPNESKHTINPKQENTIEEEAGTKKPIKAEENEEKASTSTKESGKLNDMVKMEYTEQQETNKNISAEKKSEIEGYLKEKAAEVIQKLPADDKEYIESILPTLLGSFKNVHPKCPKYIVDSSFETLVKEMLVSKKKLTDADVQFMKTIVKDEVKELKKNMPDNMIDEEDLNTEHRRGKKAYKDNRNGSSLNHINENYISNIFQFAKKNFPEDKEILQIANMRNVSASSFKKLMKSKITDSVLTRRAKLRILESGRELLTNIENWMNEGYFEQCKDREKYIFYKYKALVDLELLEDTFN